MFSAEFSSDSKKFLSKCDKNLAARIITKVEALANDPFPPDVKRVAGQARKVFRVRVGDYQSRADASKVLARLKKEGLKPILVKK